MDVAVMFSGGCGTSIGARQAGARVVWAANHNRLCVDVHAANFPDGAAICQDLSLFNHAKMEPHDALLASPVCRANSKASQPARARAARDGRRGVSALASAHNAYRALPWSVIDALEVNRPRFVVVENVPEWTAWELFPDWLRLVRRLGYKVSTQVLDAQDYQIGDGSERRVPQERERLFVIGTLGRRPVRISRPRRGDLWEPTAMRSFVDWEGGDWRPFGEARGEKMRAQLERADRVFGGAPAFINLVGHRPVFSADEPIRTATRQDQYRWVYRGRFKYPTAREGFALMGFPGDYVIPDAVADHRTVAWAMAGDAVAPPVMRAIVQRLRDD